MTLDPSVPTRGERNNNPGNIDYNPHNQWHGQLGVEEVPEGQHYAPRFARFDTTENGLRALAKLLLAYYESHSCRTVRQIVSRWAPPGENDSGAYIGDVCLALHVQPDDAIDVADPAVLQALTRAIVRHENGRCTVEAATLANACEMALA